MGSAVEMELFPGGQINSRSGMPYAIIIIRFFIGIFDTQSLTSQPHLSPQWKGTAKHYQARRGLEGFIRDKIVVLNISPLS